MMKCKDFDNCDNCLCKKCFLYFFEDGVCHCQKHGINLHKTYTCTGFISKDFKIKDMTKNKLTIEILPCPFCGGEPRIDFGCKNSIYCAECMASVSSNLSAQGIDPCNGDPYTHRSLMNAIERWNKRV